MLAALIASQSLVALVSAAPTPNEDFVVNLDRDFVNQHLGNQAFLKGKCLIAKDPKNDCSEVTLKEAEDTLDFLAEHKSCKALTTKATVKFDWEGEKFDKFPMKAFCYLRSKECGKLTKANFPNYKDIVKANSACSKAVAREKLGTRQKTPVEPVYEYEYITVSPVRTSPPMGDVHPQTWGPRYEEVDIRDEDGSRTTGQIIERRRNGNVDHVVIQTREGRIKGTITRDGVLRVRD